ncbi:MAG: dolichyl-phosphate beta-glucosyltransferase [Patescibacteria group bacterium]|nr:dolichyl-phosphate beta-glucosyltransferase [Patescibacteria group bacterium]
MEQKQKPVYSVVIPTYNEETREEEMKKHLKAIDDYFTDLGQLYETVIVLDGPTDKTPKLAKKHSAGLKNVRIIDRKKNKGKGYSVREGLLAAEGQIRLFTDMDGATPIYMLDRMIPKFQEGADIVIGSRDLDDSQVKVHQPFWKEWLGSAGNLLIQAMTGLWGVKDTQCGFKAFTEKSVKDIIPRCTVNRWGLDFEILGIGNKLGYKLEQVPVEWVDAGDSLVGISGYFTTLRDLFKFKLNMITGKYQLRKKVGEMKKTRCNLF